MMTTSQDQAFIPFHRPSIGPEEFAAVRDVLESGWLTTGPVAHKLEREFAEYIGCKHALAVNSATSALQLALDAIGLRPGDEVIVPTYTFAATGEVVTYFGGKVVLCDSSLRGFNLDVADAELRITERTKAIIPVHLAGEPCDLDAVRALAERHHLHVIEDAAHALPTDLHGERIGAKSEFAAFSFYATKAITTGEGGMITTDHDDYAERMRAMRLHGISGDAWKRYSKEGSWFYEVQHAGYKLNLPDVLAALGVAQLRKCDTFTALRRQIAERYLAAFERYQELEMPPTVLDGSHPWHLFILRIRPEMLEIGRNEFVAELQQLGIGASVHFIPLHLHPLYVREYGYKKGDFPNAEDAYSRCLSLPIYPDLRNEEIDRIIQSVTKVVERNRRRVLEAA